MCVCVCLSDTSRYIDTCGWVRSRKAIFLKKTYINNQTHNIPGGCAIPSSQAQPNSSPLSPPDTDVCICVCVCERERKRVCLCAWCVCVCVRECVCKCVYVCVYMCECLHMQSWVLIISCCPL